MFAWVPQLFCAHKWSKWKWVTGYSAILGEAQFKQWECLKCGKIDREGPYSDHGD